jgi:hypothetical protein
MLFDRRDAFERVVDFLAEAGDIVDFLRKVVEFLSDFLELRANGGELVAGRCRRQADCTAYPPLRKRPVRLADLRFVQQPDSFTGRLHRNRSR